MMVNPIIKEYPKCRDGIAAAIVSGFENWTRYWNALTILIAESILSPDASCALSTVNGVNKSIASSQNTDTAGNILVAQQTRRHTRP